MDEKMLLQLAEKEILGEAQRAAIRHSVSGPSGWQPCPLPKTNKRFLQNTLLQIISSNKIKNRKKDQKTMKKKVKERKFLQKDTPNKISKDNFIYKPSKKIKNRNKDKINSNKVQTKCTTKCDNQHKNRVKCK